MLCLLIDDHPLMLVALRAAVERAIPYGTVVSACSAGQAEKHFRRDSPPPDLILLDLNLPDMDGRRLLKLIKENERLSGTRVIVFSYEHSRVAEAECERLGAACYIHKGCDPGHLILSIKRVVQDRMPPAGTQNNHSSFVPSGVLTRRQHDLASLVVAGYSNKEIAREMGISCSTVKNHMTTIMSRMGVNSRGKLTAKLNPCAMRDPDGD